MKTVNQNKKAYTYYLEEKLGKLYSQMVNPNVSLDNMKRNVKNYIYDATYSYKVNGQTQLTKKKWFVDTLEDIDTKKGIYFLCLNSVRRARATEAR